MPWRVINVVLKVKKYFPGINLYARPTPIADAVPVTLYTFYCCCSPSFKIKVLQLVIKRTVATAREYDCWKLLRYCAAVMSAAGPPPGWEWRGQTGLNHVVNTGSSIDTQLWTRLLLCWRRQIKDARLYQRRLAERCSSMYRSMHVYFYGSAVLFWFWISF